MASLREFIDFETTHRELSFWNKVRHGGYECPNCGNGTGPDGTGMDISLKDDHVRYYCGKCERSFSIIDIWMVATGERNFMRALKAYCEYFGIDMKSAINFVSNGQSSYKPKQRKPKPKKDCTEFIIKARNALWSDAGLHAIEYLHQRKISDKSIKRFWLGYSDTYNSLIIPTSPYTYTARSLDPNIEKGERYKKPLGVSSFYLKLFEREEAKLQPIFVAEGELNTISYYELGCLAVGTGTANNHHFAKDIIERKSLITQPLILALDADSTGQKAESDLYHELTGSGIECYRLSQLVPTFYPNTETDINDLLRMEDEDDTDSLFWNIQSAKSRASQLHNQRNA